VWHGQGSKRKKSASRLIVRKTKTNRPARADGTLSRAIPPVAILRFTLRRSQGPYRGLDVMTAPVCRLAAPMLELSLDLTIGSLA